jgi:hypothetical protein
VSGFNGTQPPGTTGQNSIIPLVQELDRQQRQHTPLNPNPQNGSSAKSGAPAQR